MNFSYSSFLPLLSPHSLIVFMFVAFGLRAIFFHPYVVKLRIERGVEMLERLAFKPENLEKYGNPASIVKSHGSSGSH
jgi:hypothetical protein